MSPKTATAAAPAAPPAVDTIAIDDAQWQALATDASVDGRPHLGMVNRRRQARPELREIAQLFLGMGKTERYLVRTRNISNGGVGFNHGRPLRRGLPCHVRIVTRHNRLVEVHGFVASCRKHHDGTFEVGVMFRRAVDVNAFIGPRRRG